MKLPYSPTYLMYDNINGLRIVNSIPKYLPLGTLVSVLITKDTVGFIPTSHHIKNINYLFSKRVSNRKHVKKKYKYIANKDLPKKLLLTALILGIHIRD